MCDLLRATREDAATGGGASGRGGCDSGSESGELRRGPVLAAAEDVESSQAPGAAVHRQREQHARRRGGSGRLSGSPGREATAACQDDDTHPPRPPPDWPGPDAGTRTIAPKSGTATALWSEGVNFPPPSRFRPRAPAGSRREPASGGGQGVLFQSVRSRTTASASSRPRSVRTARPASCARRLEQAPRRRRPAARTRPVAESAVSGRPVAQPQPEHDRLQRPVGVVEQLGVLGRALAAGQPVGVGGRVLDVPPAQAADVAVRARADRPTSSRSPSTARCAGSGRRRTWPSWTPRTSRSPAVRQASRRPARSGRRARRRRASAARRGAIRRASRVPSSTISA